MIVIKLQGGLGNQMFQYAAGLSITHKLKTDLKMDLSWFDNIKQAESTRFYELDNFGLKQDFISPNQYYFVDDPIKKRLLSIGKGRLTYYKEPHFQYDNNFKKIKNDTYSEGYFQTEEYFKNIRPEVLKSFSIKNKPSVKSKEIINLAHKNESVSLHVRRGDYVTNQNASKFHCLIGEEYYKKAISIMNKKIKNPKYFIFSDEIDWVKKNLNLPKESIFVTHNKSGIEDMRIMIECKYNIIANSSFSWWGAWLGKNKDKKVIAPKMWFLDNKIDTSDIIPRRWQKI
jgi:hypothetical protein